MLKHRAITALGAAGMLALSAGQAAAQPPAGLHCGDVVTHSVRLTQDLVGCPGTGLLIGADGVTVDLAGHTLGGSRGGSVGIGDFVGHSDVTVVNGMVRDFTFGVGLEGSHGNRVSGVSFTGIDGVGVLAIESTDNRIDDDTFAAVNAPISMFRASRNRIDRNTISDAAGAGIEADGTSDDNVITANRITRTVDVGIILAVFDEDPTTPAEFPTHNVVTGNTLTDTNVGILLVEANAGEVSRNTITGAGSFGIPDSPGVGITLDGGNDNLLAANVVSHSRGDGIQIGADPENEPHPIPPAGNRLAANVSTDNGRDGIRINAIARDTALARNTADRNVGFGINALSPVTDLGGNTASANGSAAQCTGVRCGRGGRGRG